MIMIIHSSQYLILTLRCILLSYSFIQTTIGCTGDRLGVGECGVYSYQSVLPAYYQHFTRNNVGGGIGPADYCPYTDAAANGYCLDESRFVYMHIYIYIYIISLLFSLSFIDIYIIIITPLYIIYIFKC